MVRSHRLAWLFGLAVLVIAGLFGRLESGEHLASAQTPTQTLSGWAWSSNVGWIGFGGSGGPSWAGVSLKGSSGGFRYLEGYAWNNNIGWIRFDPIIGSGGNALPAGQSGTPARLNENGPTLKFEGWARACSVFVSGCGGTLMADIDRGGWDGWIKMGSGIKAGVSYEITLNSSNELVGQAWGAEVLGWIDFCDQSANNFYCVRVNQINVECSGVATASDITWSATPVGASYDYFWGNGYFPDAGGDVGGTGSTLIETYSSNPSDPDYIASGVRVANLVVENGVSNIIGQATCSVTIPPAVGSIVKLRINVAGSGSVSYPAGVGPAGSCSGPAGTCDVEYNLGDLVSLSAVAVDPFKGWGGDAQGCGLNLSPCDLTMDNNKLVTATFGTIGGGGPNWNPVGDPIMTINRHDLGSPARSTGKLVENTSIDETVNVCVSKVESLVSVGSSLDSILQGDGNKGPAICHLGNLNSGSCDSISAILNPASGIVGANDGSRTNLFIEIPKKSLAARDNSPYGVWLGAIDSVTGLCDPADPNNPTFEFRYQPFGFSPI